MLALLNELKQQQIISAADYYLAKLISDKQQGLLYSEQQKNLAILLTALCSYHYQQGNTALFFNTKTAQHLFQLNYRHTEQDYLIRIQQKINFLPVEKWQACLNGHIAFTQNPLQQIAPFVFQYNGLYFYRTWQDEYRVASYFCKAIQQSQNAEQQLDIAKIRQFLDYYFPTQRNNALQQIDWQKVAVATALRQPFCLITGGPGTGKTTTVTRLLLALQELHCHKLNIQLVAPTGKAAARLTESINNALVNLQQKEGIILSEALLQSIPTEAQTLHRLLGTRLFEDRPHFHQQNPLLLDVLVVDEASMIDLPMMAKLVQALKPSCKLILLGDANQLSPVEAGEMLGELSQFKQDNYSVSLTDYLSQVADIQLPASSAPFIFRDYLCDLQHSHRFSASSGIGQLAGAINQGNVVQSLTVFEQFSDIRFQFFSPEQTEMQCAEQVVQSAVENYRTYLQLIPQNALANNKITEQQVDLIFQAFNQVRFLTALRGSMLGVEMLNQHIAQALQKNGLLKFKNERDWYIGKPIMITQNNSSVGLYNGDVGLYLGGHKVWFEQGKGRYKTVLTSRVPEYETAFVMTVHKSQGSEFDHTLLVLPAEMNPVLSRELIYTGVTRAKQQLTVFGHLNIWKSTVRKPISRQSGLRQQLMELLRKSD